MRHFDLTKAVSCIHLHSIRIIPSSERVVKDLSGKVLSRHHDVEEIGQAHLRNHGLDEVVLPLPGSEIVYPRHLVDDYEDIAWQMLGVPLESFNEVLPCDLTFEGRYRAMAVIPQQVSLGMVDPDTAESVARLHRGRLLLTDLDRLNGVEDHLGAARPPGRPPASEQLPSDVATRTGSAVLSCILPPSAYLTVAVRELTKS
eukprot:TRINITY_DN34888_c0_g1_i1.p1 TRINITY_DN34888_c0_g1~~TRINITY_DN34888_c0_g1_i1.p1  ORF type:complete len:201 (-),score=19.86 TRINITY_DN34888_c0_g1_i1:5-607(-)